MNDPISRQEAIDIVLEYAKRLHEPVGTPEDNEMYSYGRGLLLSIERNLKQLPPAQPEIIYCKDCIHRPIIDDPGAKGGFGLLFPDFRCPCRCDDPYYSWMPNDNWFCGNGEKGGIKDERTT